MPAGFVPLTAASIHDALGNPLAAGFIEVIPTDTKDTPIAASCGGILISSPGVATVTSGALPANTTIPQSSATLPPNVCFRITIKDETGAPIQTLRLVQPQADGLNLDTYQPNVPTQAIVQYGPKGDTGAPGVASLPALAALFTRLPAGANLFNAATVTPGNLMQGNGALVAAAGYSVSDFIPANAGGKMVATNLFTGDDVAVVFFDTGYSYVSFIETPNYAQGQPFSVPAAAAFLRVQLAAGDVTSTMVVNGTALPGSFVAFGAVAPNQVASQIAASVSAAIDPLQSEIDSALPPDVSGNLFDASAVVAGHYVDPSTGALVDNSAFESTGFIACRNAGSLATNQGFIGGQSGPVGGISFFDKNKSFLAGQSYTAGANGPGSFPVPVAAYYCRFWWVLSGAPQTASTMDVVVGAVIPATHQAFNANAGNATVNISSAASLPSRWKGKALGLFGTSISAFNVWQQQIAAAKGMTIGFDGSIAGSHTGQAFDKLFASSSTLPSQGGAINQAAFATALAGVDVVLIEYGTNDLYFIQYQGVANGTVDSAPSLAASDSMGWVDYLLTAIRTARPDVPIIWISPYHVERYPGVPVISANNEEASQHYDDAHLNAWTVTLYQKCLKFGVPIIDQRYNQIDRFTMCDIHTGAANMLRDKLHPSTKGYTLCMSPYISRQMELFAQSI